jgi:hypothetical protein
MVLMHLCTHGCDHNNSGHADRRTVAGRALGDLVRKLGDTVSITDTLLGCMHDCFRAF